MDSEMTRQADQGADAGARRYALWLAWGQAPLRLLFMQPSLSLGLWLIQAAGVRHVAILAGFLLLSEGLKIASLWYCRGGIQGIKR